MHIYTGTDEAWKLLGAAARARATHDWDQADRLHAELVVEVKRANPGAVDSDVRQAIANAS